MNKPTQTLTNVLELLELDDVIFPDHEWVGTTRASLYRAAITALAECAVDEGFKVTIETADDGYPVCEVTYTPDDENPASLMPDDPD